MKEKKGERHSPFCVRLIISAGQDRKPGVIGKQEALEVEAVAAALQHDVSIAAGLGSFVIQTIHENAAGFAALRAHL